MPKTRSAPETTSTRDVKFTHEDRLMFPEAELTKHDLLAYYDAIADLLIPHLRDRPMTLERLPEGVGDPKAPHFWQKNTPIYYPKWIPRVPIKTADGRRVQYLLVNDRDALLYLVNQGTITFHTWFSRVEDPDRPDFVLFDIDPHQSTFADAIKTARALHDVLDDDGCEGFLKTSGKSGLHVLTPWRDKGGFDQAVKWARSIAERVVKAIPTIATTARPIHLRKNRVYLDVEQNSKGKHVVPPYVVRPTPLATVSMPLKWSELTARLDPTKFTIKTAVKRLTGKADPMGGLLE
jgi:bifunctional non-homologous end joining protein LigD